MVSAFIAKIPILSNSTTNPNLPYSFFMEYVFYVRKEASLPEWRLAL
jgi:hypothetical protein